MAHKLIINISKKIPGAQEYSSLQASCSIEGEIAAGQDPAAEAARLYAVAEAAVDAQLYRQPGAFVPRSSPQTAPLPPAPPQAAPPAPSAPPGVGALPIPTHQPGSTPNGGSHPGGGRAYAAPGRRTPAPITASQLRFISQLIERNGASRDAILHQFQIGDLSQLTAKQASGLIDQLRGAPA